MRNAALVKSRFWIGGTGRKVLRQHGQRTALTALYLVTSPHSHMSGLYYLPLALAASELCITEGELLDDIRALEEVGFARYDGDAGIVWVINMLAHQVSRAWNERDSRAKTIRLHLQGLPETRLLHAFCTRYGVSLEAPSDGGSTGGPGAGPNPSSIPNPAPTPPDAGRRGGAK